MATASKVQIDVPLQPKQAQLYELVEHGRAANIGFGGSRGGSKSHVSRAIQIIRRLKYPKTRGLIFRRTFDDLWENHIEPLFAQYPFMRAWYHTQHKELTLPGGGVIKFGYAEHAGDINDFQGKQYMDISVDEATKLSEAERNFLKTCNRWPGMPDWMCKFIETMNPGGIGHAHIKRLYIDRKYRGDERAEDYVFLQAYGWDNIEWVRASLQDDGISVHEYYDWTDEQRKQYFLTRSQYGRELNALPAAMRIGHLLGRWDVFAGQYFDIWDPAIHTARPETFQLPEWQPRWIACDWGYAHPSAVGWFGQNGKVTQQYKEFVKAGLSPRALAQEICDGSEGVEIEAIFLSPDAFAKRTNQQTIAEQMGEVFRRNNFPQPTPADDDRAGGWMLMYQMLAAGEWVVGSNCTATIETLPMLTRDEKKPEDCVKFDATERSVGDDAADMARYALKSRFKERKPPLGVRVEERMKTASENMSVRMIQKQIAEHEERQAQPGSVAIRRPWMARRWSRN